jgi:Xaa-Pro aminopeptidase
MNTNGRAEVLLYGDTVRNAALRHEVPISVIDPFLYAEVAGRTYILTSSIERERLKAIRPDAQLLDFDELGYYELIESARSRQEVANELASRAARTAGITEAIVDYEFPLGLAERLRADGIRLTVDGQAIKARRRAKSDAELSGIRIAQRAAEAAMAAAAEVLSRAQPTADGMLQLDGQTLRAEQVRAAMREACWKLGTLLGPDAIVASVWQGGGHEPGSGPLPAGLPIQIDLWPQHEESGCWADMTRTFVVGEHRSEEIRRQEALVHESIERARAAIRPGITGRELHALSCEPFEKAGYRTQRTGPGDDPDEGFQFSLGHGVGLQVHEDPSLGQAGHSQLVVGDVIAIEPGLWQRDVGGVRFEDLVLVTEDGHETLTEYRYDLTP